MTQFAVLAEIDEQPHDRIVSGQLGPSHNLPGLKELHQMRLSVAVLTGALLTGSLVACSNGYGVPQTASISTDRSAQTHVKVLPVELRSSAILAKIHAAAGPDRADAVTPGIYACCDSSGLIDGYSGNDRSNEPPVCSIGPVDDTFGIAIDRQGDLLVPDYKARTITIYAGPGLCGPKLGTLAEPYGEPFDVASRNAANGGKIVVANALNVGSVSVCTLSGGCTTELKPDGPVNFVAVALAPNGDCWGSGTAHASRKPVLVYFAHCRGRGVIATGFQSPNTPYSLDIDDNGNLVTVSYFYISGKARSQLYIHSGCNPTCSLVGGPFQLKDYIIFGHLDASSKLFVGAAYSAKPQLEVYSYSTSGIKYEYSITNGLGMTVTTAVSAAFSPSSKE